MLKPEVESGDDQGMRNKVSGATVLALVGAVSTRPATAKSCRDEECARRKIRISELKEQLCGADRDRRAAMDAIRREWRYARQAGVVDLANLKEQRDAIEESDDEINGHGDDYRAGDEWRELTGKRFDPKVCIAPKPLPVLTHLPKDPPPRISKKDLPKWESKLSSSEAYPKIWQPENRESLELFLSAVSQVVARGAYWGPTLEQLNAGHRDLKDAAITTFMIVVRTGHLPPEMEARIRNHLEAIHGEEHLGVWTSGEEGHDYSALAAWLNPDSAEYFREFLAARAGVPIGRFSDEDDYDQRPWLAYLAFEREATSRYQTLLLLAANKGQDVSDEDCDVIGMSVRPAGDKRSPLCREVRFSEAATEDEP